MGEFFTLIALQDLADKRLTPFKSLEGRVFKSVSNTHCSTAHVSMSDISLLQHIPDIRTRVWDAKGMPGMREAIIDLTTLQPATFNFLKFEN